jgi:hypothetical protein
VLRTPPQRQHADPCAAVQVWAAWVPPEATELDVVAVGITQVTHPSAFPLVHGGVVGVVVARGHSSPCNEDDETPTAEADARGCP